MDTHLKKVLSDVKVLDSELREERSNVKGVLLADSDGMPISASGTLNPSLSGSVAAVAKTTAKFEGKDSETPVVVIEQTDNTSILIKQEENVVVAIHKKH